MDHFDAYSMVDFMRRVISGAAAEGKSVIVGRGALFLLRGCPDTFQVFVYASHEQKIRRLREAYDLTINSGVGNDVVIDTILNQVHSITAKKLPSDFTWQGRS